MKKIDLSIGITAYNEEENIENILKSLLGQKNKFFILREIIVVSDGSTDKTAEIIKGIKNKKLIIKIHKIRHGQAFRQNQITKLFKGEVLVFAEADTLPKGSNVLDNLLRPLTESPDLDLVLGDNTTPDPDGFYKKILFVSEKLKEGIFRNWKKGDNVYWTGGHALKAIRRQFALSLNFPVDVPEDAYIYFLAKSKGKTYKKVANANVYKGIADNFKDAVKQSNKYITGKNSLKKYFGNKYIEKEYSIPRIVVLKGVLSSLWNYPFWTLLYLLQLPLNRMFSFGKNYMNPTYDIYTSSKKVIPEGTKAKTKIVISNYDDITNPYYAGGGALATDIIARHLSQKYEVRVYTGNYRNAQNGNINGVNYIRLGFPWAGPAWGQLIFSAILPFKVMTDKFDIWLESFTPPFSTGLLPLFTNKPVVGVVHMLSAEDMKRKYKLPFNWVENFGLRFYKYFICTTPSNAGKVKLYAKKALAAIIPNGTFIPKIKAGKRKYLLYMGRIEINQKGIDLLIEAFSKAVLTKKMMLYIAGSGTPGETEKLKEMIKDKGVGKYIRLLGHVGFKEKGSLYQLAKAVIIASRFESFCMVALEAMSYGTPVISFDIEGLKWIPGNLITKVKPFDSDKLSVKMTEVFADNPPALLKKKEIAFARKLSRENISKKYEDQILSFIRYSNA